MALALYLFLAWAIYTLWIDLRRRKSGAALHAPPISLAHNEDGATRIQRFQSPEVLLGRDPACDLTVEDRTISAQHARLAYHHSQWWVEDLKSTNGTFLNGEPVSEPMVVISGDQLRLGGWSALIRLE